MACSRELPNHVANTVRTYLLEKRRYIFGGYIDIDGYMKRGQMSIEVIADEMERRLVYQVEMFFAGTSKKETETRQVCKEKVFVPKDWWEALKDRFIPILLRKYIKIEYRTIETWHNISNTTKITHVCPHLPMQPNCDHVRFAAMEGLPPLHEYLKNFNGESRGPDY